jgi:hypothetical protein
MKKARKVVRIVLLAVVILVIVVAAAIRLFADRAVKMGIEKAGSKALNVGVKFQNLAIDNPPHYQQEKLLELKDAYIAVNVRSLLSDVVNIKDIKLVGANLVVEQKGISSNNLRDIMKSIPSGKKLHIDNLELSEVTVRVKLLPVSGKSDTVTLKLKPIKMTDLGGDNKLDVAGLSRKILLALAGGVAEQGEGVLPDEIIGSLSDQLKRLGALSGAWLDEGGRILKEGTDLR